MQELPSGPWCLELRGEVWDTEYLNVWVTSHTLQWLRWSISMNNGKEASLIALPPNSPSLVWKVPSFSLGDVLVTLGT